MFKNLALHDEVVCEEEPLFIFNHIQICLLFQNSGFALGLFPAIRANWAEP